MKRKKHLIPVLFLMCNLLNINARAGDFSLNVREILNLCKRTPSIRTDSVVKGRVISETGEGLPGVNVVVKGTTNGTATDVNGNYQLTINDPEAILIFSFIGYVKEEVPAKSQSILNIILLPDLQILNEVVVIGYGSARKGDIAGAVSTLDAKAIKDIPIPSLSEALTGRVAGVQISTTDGAPGAEPIIRVRGGGSITQDNSPLLIVDGFPVNSINDIAPSSIENVVVLKDAASTAIYGARGANGVILITTKNPKSGKTTVTFNTWTQRKFLPKERKMKVLSPYEYVLAQYEYAKLKGSDEMTLFNKYYGDYDDIDIYKNIKGKNWQDEIFSKYKQFSRYLDLNVNGGNEQTKINLGVTQINDDGLVKTSSYNRTNLNFKLNHQINKKLKLEVNSRYSNSTTNGAGTSGGADLRISDIITARPTNGLADFIDLSSPGSTNDDDFEKLLEGLILPTEKVRQDYRQSKAKQFNLNAALNWNILKDLTYRAEIGVGYNTGLSKRYWGPLTSRSRNDGFNLPMGQRTSTEAKSYRLVNTLTYSLKRSIHNINIMVGQEIYNNSASSQDMTAISFPLGIAPERMFANFSKGTIFNQSTFISADERLASFFGRGTYTLKNRYILNLTLRVDGSSKFAPGKQWGVFPAASFAWRLVDEKFMEFIPLLSDLKLRVSYGEAGNNRMANDLWRSVYSISNSRSIGYGETVNPYYIPGGVMPNPALKWETTITQNAGMDFSFLNDRLSGSLDFYHNRTTDLLIEAEVPASTSYKTQMQNIGVTSNKGMEIALNGKVVNTKDFNLTGTFNIAFNRFKVDELDGNTERPVYSNWASSSDLKNTDDYRMYVGQQLGLMYGYVSDGFYSVDDFEGYDATTKKYILKEGQPTIESLANNIGLRPGIIKVKDLDGDGAITTDDRKVIGHASAKHSGGFGLNASYKGFDLGMFFTWKYGFDVYNTSKIQFNALYRNNNANLLNTSNSDNRFKYVNADGNLVTDLEELRELNKNATTWTPFSSASSVLVFQSSAVEDGSYLRLSNVTLGYTLPKKIIAKILIQQLRVYGTINNAWLFTKYSGYDPEVSTNRSNSNYSNLSPNVDYSSYPKNRSVTVGLNVTF